MGMTTILPENVSIINARLAQVGYRGAPVATGIYPNPVHSTTAPSDAQATVIHGPVSLSAITMAANVNANARAWANGTLARRFAANHAITPFHALRMPATIAVEPALS